ncbi:uncharacterized protein AMSG_04328 [Thecamonas trahens ATCC 50062]|uniref:PH domain-containing protein n=1 Tax=Thecamonas trahens ATCC 50062 TaxID=461836 RepID=A0A0L0D9Z4_THETB|nr:hypothetical protein AMSG_04328 [Thecamonas trahens ATCC 50062]KNC48098.1 hypothetical protein AMSG_04328 [Thecamonas trahens ATCC 50062]|eukprot:XP_013758674.1 hypothetical protein AMSG_04328 [Thecamonas trahens ATCC 50062]
MQDRAGSRIRALSRPVAVRNGFRRRESNAPVKPRRFWRSQTRAGNVVTLADPEPFEPPQPAAEEGFLLVRKSEAMAVKAKGWSQRYMRLVGSHLYICRQPAADPLYFLDLPRVVIKTVHRLPGGDGVEWRAAHDLPTSSESASDASDDGSAEHALHKAPEAATAGLGEKPVVWASLGLDCPEEFVLCVGVPGDWHFVQANSEPECQRWLRGMLYAQQYYRTDGAGPFGCGVMPEVVCRVPMFDVLSVFMIEDEGHQFSVAIEARHEVHILLTDDEARAENELLALSQAASRVSVISYPSSEPEDVPLPRRRRIRLSTAEDELAAAIVEIEEEEQAAWLGQPSASSPLQPHASSAGSVTNECTPVDGLLELPRAHGSPEQVVSPADGCTETSDIVLDGSAHWTADDELLYAIDDVREFVASHNAVSLNELFEVKGPVLDAIHDMVREAISHLEAATRSWSLSAPSIDMINEARLAACVDDLSRAEPVLDARPYDTVHDAVNVLDFIASVLGSWNRLASALDHAVDATVAMLADSGSSPDFASSASKLAAAMRAARRAVLRRYVPRPDLADDLCKVIGVPLTECIVVLDDMTSALVVACLGQALPGQASPGRAPQPRPSSPV